MFEECVRPCHLTRAALAAFLNCFVLMACFIAPVCSLLAYAQFPAPSFSSDPFMLGVPVDFYIPTQPQAFRGTDHKDHLAYELHISNFSKADLALKQLEILDDASGKPLASYAGADLEKRLMHKSEQPGNPMLVGGKWSVVFVWLDFDTGNIPHRLRHRLQVVAPGFTQLGMQSIEGGATDVSTGPRVIGPPLTGGLWWAADGPSNDAGHRRTLIAVDGKARIPERFATDWAKVDETGQLLKGDATKNSSYFGYGSEVLAVADGTVVSLLDGLVENTPDAETRAAPMTLANMGGNYVILDIGQQQYAFYAHLQPESIRVKVGDHVRRGQVLALVGDSGNATGPHLHFQISDRNSELGTEGLPFVIDSFRLAGKMEGEKLSAYPAPESIRQALPLDDDVIVFP